MTKTRATARNWGGARTGAGRKPGKKRLNVKGTVTSLKEHGEKRPDGRRNITEADQPCLQKVEAIFAQVHTAYTNLLLDAVGILIMLQATSCLYSQPAQHQQYNSSDVILLRQYLTVGCLVQLRELTGASTNSEMLVIASQHPSLGVSSTDAQLAALRSRE